VLRVYLSAVCEDVLLYGYSAIHKNRLKLAANFLVEGTECFELQLVLSTTADINGGNCGYLSVDRDYSGFENSVGGGRRSDVQKSGIGDRFSERSGQTRLEHRIGRVVSHRFNVDAPVGI